MKSKSRYTHQQSSRGNMCRVPISMSLSFSSLSFVLFHFCFRLFLHLDIRIEPSCSLLYTHTHSFTSVPRRRKQNTTIEFILLRNTFKCIQTDSLLSCVSIILSWNDVDEEFLFSFALPHALPMNTQNFNFSTLNQINATTRFLHTYTRKMTV